MHSARFSTASTRPYEDDEEILLLFIQKPNPSIESDTSTVLA